MKLSPPRISCTATERLVQPERRSFCIGYIHANTTTLPVSGSMSDSACWHQSRLRNREGFRILYCADSQMTTLLQIQALLRTASGRLHEEFGNGEEYYRLHGVPTREPVQANYRPDADNCECHVYTCFLLSQIQYVTCTPTVTLFRY